MPKYYELPREQIEQVAGALADILQSMGFDTMAADCRGPRKQGDLPQYAKVTVKNLRGEQPKKVAPLLNLLRPIGLA